MQFKTIEEETWKELKGGQDKFQHILRLLVNFEEQNQQERLSCLFYLRKALGLCEASQLRIFLRSLGGYLFHVVAQLDMKGGRMATAWLHEDGIQAERDSRYTQKTHPVHQIVCLNDLYDKQTQSISLDLTVGAPSEAALDLMLDE